MINLKGPILEIFVETRLFVLSSGLGKGPCIYLSGSLSLKKVHPKKGPIIQLFTEILICMISND